MPNRVCVLRYGWQPFIMTPLWNLIDALHSRGVACTVVKSYARSDLGFSEEPHPRAEARYFRLCARALKRVPVLGKAAPMLGWAEFQARAFWRAWRTEAGVVVSIDVDTLPAAWLAARLKRAGLVFYSYELYTDREWMPAKWFWAWLERRLIKRADVVVACEPNRGRILQERYGLAETPMTVLNVPPRAEPRPRTGRIRAYLRAQGIGDTAKIAYFHGWIIPIRCCDTFVEAMRQVDDDVVLFFIGPIEAAFKQELLTKVAAYGLEKRVVFHPMAASEELMEFAVDADLGLQAQLNVGLNSYYCAPIKLYQYLSAGLPVVASNFPGMLEVVEQNNVGRCVDPESVDDIAAAINEVMRDDALRREMSENALRIARERYCYEVEGEKLLDAIARLLKRGKERT